MKYDLKRIVSLLPLCFILIFTSCGSESSSFTTSTQEAIKNGTITQETLSKEYSSSEDQLKYLTKQLTQFQKENDIEKALALIYAVPGGHMKGDSFLDGEYAYASEDFVNWIKNAVVTDEPGIQDYYFKWNASMVMNQFTFKKAGEDKEITVYTINPGYKNLKGNRYMAGMGESSTGINYDFSNYPDVEYNDSKVYETTYAPASTERKTTTSSGKTCPACHGFGEVQQYYTDDPFEEPHWETCAMCKGTGKV